MSKYDFRYFADQDLQVAQSCIESRRNYGVASSLMQQAIEKMLKHILVLKNIQAPKPHSLHNLYNLALPNTIKAHQDILMRLTFMYKSMRYPNDEFFELDTEYIQNLWHEFSELYMDLEKIADELERHPQFNDKTDLF